MVTTELGACEWFVWDLRRSNLIDRGQLDQLVGEFLGKNARAEPPALAEHLVQQGILTPFQAERLLQGKTQGFVLGPFTLMDALGTGSMGTVYKAQSKTDSQWYAVKVLPRRSMWNVRIARRKVRAFESCRHAAVVPFVDVGTAGGMHYLAWPFVDGHTLDKIVQQQGKLPPALVAHYALQIAEGLEVCHQQGLFHGLLKPSNLILGDDDQIRILDFGIGCLLAETEGESLVDTMSTANAVSSGLDCASPESIMDPTKLAPTGDQYSLGCILYYMLTGQYPFPTGSAADKMMAHQFKDATPIAELNPNVPAELIEIVDRLMKKKAEERYGSVGEFVEALRPLAKNAPAPAARPARAPAKPRDLAAAVKPASAPGIRPAAPAKPKSVEITPSRSAGSASSGGSVGPSQPTPRPPAMPSGLPGRDTPRPSTAAPAASSKPAPAPAPAATQAPPKPREIPGNVPGLPESGESLEESLGPVGVTFGAIAACALVWLVAAWLRLF